jgi:hypothetical protein
MSQPDMTASPDATGYVEIDAAVGRLVELDELPVNEHHDRLGQAHEVLDRALHPERARPDPSF